MRPSPLGGDAVLKATDISATGGEVASRVQFQLTGPADVKAAHAYFQPTGGEAHLPAISGLTGTESSAVHLAGHLASKVTEGAALTMATKAGEGAAMTAAQQAGAQVVSPLIQMIMRMPGHLGLMTSFFEALGHFFMGQDILGGLSETAHLMTQHAESAMHAISSAAEHLGIHVELFPQDGDSMLNSLASATTDAHGAMLSGTGEMSSSLIKAPSLDTSNMSEVGKNALNASGYADLSNGQFEHSVNSSMNDGSQPAFNADPNEKFLAWDTGSAAFRPTLSGVQPPLTNVQLPQATPPAPPAISHAANAAHAPSHPAHAAHGMEKATNHEVARASGHHSSGRGSLLDSSNDATPEAASPTEQTAGSDNVADANTSSDGAQGDAATHDYTVRHGDNLWDIARTHLGDANKWTEIYHLNQDVIGDNPAMIHEGTTLHLPGSDSIASGDYVVKPGDNLWDISQSHLGGGQHWSEVYHANEDLIGSNPSLIHPGQHLTVSTDAASQHLASAPAAHAHTIAHAGPPVHPHHSVNLAQAHQHLSAANPATQHHIAQAAPSHAQAHAAAQESTQAVASADHAAGATPAVAQQGMHAQAGSLAALNPAVKFDQISAE